MLLESALLGLIEGVTEFLPISSTAHLFLASWVLNRGQPYSPQYSFEIIIQSGAILALMIVYRGRLKQFFHPTFILNIGIAFLPLAILGVLFYSVIIGYLFDLKILCAALILGGAAMLAVERLPLSRAITSIRKISWKVALMIGLIQSLALIPGTSRAAATIVGGLICGLDRKTAVEFSFFLAISVCSRRRLLSRFFLRSLDPFNAFQRSGLRHRFCDRPYRHSLRSCSSSITTAWPLSPGIESSWAADYGCLLSETMKSFCLKVSVLLVAFIIPLGGLILWAGGPPPSWNLSSLSQWTPIQSPGVSTNLISKALTSLFGIHSQEPPDWLRESDLLLINQIKQRPCGKQSPTIHRASYSPRRRSGTTAKNGPKT